MIAETDIQLSQVIGARAYSSLRKIVENENILKRDYKYYISQISITYLGFFTAVLFLLYTNSYTNALIFSIILGFFSARMTGLIHDSGHMAIFKRIKNNDFLGRICCSLIATNYSDWKKWHNKHHSSPNIEDEDPDLEVPLLAYTKEKHQTKKGFVKYLVKYQAYLYFPLLTQTFIYIRTKNKKYLSQKFTIPKLLELFTFIATLFIWYIIPFLIFDPIKAAIVVLTVNIIGGFYVGNIVAPNHKGMPHIKKGVELSFLEKQIRTTRNVKPGWFNDFIYMGLNYQMEHHLFPNCPRNKLKLIRPHLKKLCREIGLTYTETGIIESNKIILKELHKISAIN